MTAIFNSNPAVDAYIAQQPTTIQPLLKQVRQLLQKTLPDCEEKMSYGMPTYRGKHNIIHFGANKKHLGIYPGPAAIVAFSAHLTDYKTSKGAIQFPYDQPLPDKLIADMARWAWEADS